MKASYRWLCELLPALKASPDELALRLTSAGLAVDGVAKYGEATKVCVVAEVKSVRPHPERANLRLVTVDRGGATQEVVCGAPNVPEPGGLVVLAPLGAHLPAKNLTIAKRSVAGVESAGMLCSEAELGLSEDAAGILFLPRGTAAPGTPLAQAVPATDDVIYELDLTPNRPDALGHIGIARDVAALYGMAWAPPPSAAAARDAGESIERLVEVHIDDLERCPHYGAAAAVDVTIGPSPAWLRYRLSALGVRPISNVVDITNLLMLEFGHPMHGFDLDLVRGREIRVRRARAGEELTTLDGVARKLTDDDLLICDGSGPTALAGVMGGAISEVSDQTKRVLFECAYFDARGVRRSARRHGMHTEASHRFERGVDPADASALLARAVALTTELAGGAAVSGQIHAGTAKPEKRKLKLEVARVSQLIGSDVPYEETLTTLERLGCEVEQLRVAELLQVSVPTHRPDLQREVDLIGEVARIRGIDRVEPLLPSIRPTRDAGPREALASRMRATAVALGLSEAITFAFASQRELAAVGAPEPSVLLQNPINELHTVLRTSLLPGLFDALGRARRHGLQDVRLFTIGSRYLRDKELPEERLSFAAVVAGARPAYLEKPQAVDVWDAQGLAEALASRLTRREVSVRALPLADRPSYLHPRGAGGVFVEGRQIGMFGILHPSTADAFELDVSPLVVELDGALLAELGTLRPVFKEIPRFPPSRRDLAVVVPDAVAAGDVREAIRRAAGPLAEQVELFDRFVGGAIAKQHASLAFRVVYRAPDRTLTDAEVDKAHAQVVAAIEQQFGAQLRG
jgi:phenylalanyl-tRNA synthetase beta chain